MRKNGRVNVSDDDEDALPFARFICRLSFVDPWLPNASANSVSIVLFKAS